MGGLPDDSGKQTVSADERREANPHYGIADRIAIALFPFLEGSADNNKEAGQ
jgi:hypothetical protein